MKILLTDDHAVVRQGYAALLATMFEGAEVIEADSAAAAITECRKQLPDLMVMDINMPDMNGIEALKQISRDLGQVKTLFFTMYEELPVLTRALEAGAKGYITKSSPPDRLIEAVRAIVAGQVYIQPELADRLNYNGPLDLDARFSELSPREQAIFLMLAQGNSQEQISRCMDITAKTVANYTAILKGKLGIKSSAEFVYIAIEKEMIKL